MTASKYAYVLRTCAADGTSYGGFVWPRRGKVEASDWDPEPRCGGGLHGLLDGQGDGSLLRWEDDAIWQVVRILRSDAVDIDGSKVKFPRGTVIVSGARQEATDYLVAKGLTGVVGATVTAGNYGQATAGYGGQATAGNDGHATAGNYGHATAGPHGHATAGYGGQATAGNYGHATAGYGGHATAGYGGVLVILRWNGKRYKASVADVGEDGIEPNVAYRLDDDGNFVKAEVPA